MLHFAVAPGKTNISVTDGSSCVLWHTHLPKVQLVIVADNVPYT